MAEVADDHMRQRWCCTTCSSKFRFGELRCSDVVRCPVCNATTLHPAFGTVITLESYYGEVGTIN